MIDFDTAAKVGGVLMATAGVVWGVVTGRHRLKRHVSHERVDNANDEAEVGMLSRAQAEAREQRERADLAFKERNEAVGELGKLRYQVEMLKEHRIECDRRLAEVEGRMIAMQAEINVLRRRADDGR